MKHTQAKSVVGYVTIHIKGKHPEWFFHECARRGIVVLDIKKIGSRQCTGSIYVHHLQNVKQLIKRMPYELIKVTTPMGVKPKISSIWSHKQYLVATCLAIALLFFLSHMAWKVNITGVSEEVEQQIRKHLTHEGLYEGAWTGNLKDVDHMQQAVLSQMPNLMYIGIHKNGTAYHIDAIEKKQEQLPETLSPRHLVAGKNGEISSVFVKRGMRKVAVHDMVKKGDMLVSGFIEDMDEKEEDEETIPSEKVAAEGEIYANTWYEMDVTSAIQTSEQILTGQSERRYTFTLFGYTFPIWGKQPISSDYLKEQKHHSFHMFQYEFPLSLHVDTYYETKKQSFSRTKQEMRKDIVQHIEQALQRSSGKDAKVLYYKILHERVDSGKVKINLYVSVLEDIAQPKEMK